QFAEGATSCREGHRLFSVSGGQAPHRHRGGPECAMKRPDDGRSERIRRVRLGDLRRLLMHRYRGPVLSDDDAARDDLRELLLPISLGPDPRKRMPHAISLWAPWMPQNEIDRLVEDIERTEPKERKRTAKDLGERMNLTNAERERFRLWTIAAFDMTAAESVE